MPILQSAYFRGSGKLIMAKERYSIRVSRSGESIGEYVFNATPKGLEQLKERIRPELSYDILSTHGIIHTYVAASSQAIDEFRF